MKIEHYISRLLYRYQCVTVPGFGAFLAEFQSAQIQESSNSFYPPKKRISFNPHLKNNDGLLANHIAESEKTSYDDAVLSIQNEVAIWKDILKVNGYFTLKNIGELSLNADQNVVFSPSENLNYFTGSFGLGSFVSPKVKREEYKEDVRIIEETVPIAFTPETRKNSSWLKYAAVFLLAFSATGAVGYSLYNNQVERQTLLVQQQVQQQVHQHAVHSARVHWATDLWHPARSLPWPPQHTPATQDSEPAPAPSEAALAGWRHLCTQLLATPTPFNNA
ncbi:MAG: hypothetical protein EOO68_37550, partial [Moraxellaceae bacterium]